MAVWPARPRPTQIRSRLLDTLNQMGWQVQPLVLHEEKIAYCLGCFECWTKTPGLCRIDDGGREWRMLSFTAIR